MTEEEPLRPLAERAERLDRAARFEERLARLREDEARADRRDRRLRLALALSTTTVAVVVGYLIGGSVGVLIGFGAVIVGAATVVLVRRIAAGRGASAWDWQAGRHRLFGDPSLQVRGQDGPARRPSQD